MRWTKTQNYICSPSTLGSLTPKQAALKEVYLPPVSSEANAGRILKTNELQQIEQPLNSNQHLFCRQKTTPFINFRWATEKILKDRLPNIFVFQKVWRAITFFVRLREENQKSSLVIYRMKKLIYLSSLLEFTCKNKVTKKNKKTSRFNLQQTNLIL